MSLLWDFPPAGHAALCMGYPIAYRLQAELQVPPGVFCGRVVLMQTLAERAGQRRLSPALTEHFAKRIRSCGGMIIIINDVGREASGNSAFGIWTKATGSRFALEFCKMFCTEA